MIKKQYKVELSSEAENDFDNSYEYYAKKGEKVADNFYKQINSGLETIAKNPHGFQRAFKNIRRYVILKNPFVIYYRIENMIIQVIAIFHTSRNPKIWKQRTENNH